jgi:hypothetical protein
VGDKRLNSALQPVSQLTVEHVEMKFNLRFLQLRSKISRHVAEGCNPQILRHELQLRMTFKRPSYFLRQAEIVR